MRHPATFAFTALVLPLALPPGAIAADAETVLEGLVPHRAVYDLALNEGGSGSSITAATGRLVFEFDGSVCEGFTVTSRFVTRLSDLDGANRLTDLRSATYETVDPPSYTFRHRTFVNEVEQDEMAGRATRVGGTVAVTLEEPEESEETIEAPGLFPTRQVAEILTAAMDGVRIHEARVFDASDTGVKVYSTTAIVGERREGIGPPGRDDPEALAALPDDVPYWRVNLSYFDPEDDTSGEVLPSYELAFMLYENGISRDITFDYGSFALDGSLVELEVGEVTPCE